MLRALKSDPASCRLGTAEYLLPASLSLSARRISPAALSPVTFRSALSPVERQKETECARECVRLDSRDRGHHPDALDKKHRGRGGSTCSGEGVLGKEPGEKREEGTVLRSLRNDVF